MGVEAADRNVIAYMLALVRRVVSSRLSRSDGRENVTMPMTLQGCFLQFTAPNWNDILKVWMNEGQVYLF